MNYIYPVDRPLKMETGMAQSLWWLSCRAYKRDFMIRICSRMTFLCIGNRAGRVW